MSERSKKKSGGAPKGNQNARKHGCYSRVLSESEQVDFRDLSGIEGIDDEITLLRVKIKSLVEHDPQNIKLITRLVNSLGRLVRIKQNIGENDKTSIGEAVANFLGGIPLPPGVIPRLPEGEGEVTG